MFEKPTGIVLLAGVLFLSGLAGIVAVWAMWPATPDTSPLATLFASVWTCTYLVAAFLTWRRSRLAAPAFVAALGLLLFPLLFLVPGSRPTILVVVILLGAALGSRYLYRSSAPAV